MQMTPEARETLDGIVARVLARHPLSGPERAGVQYELMSHVHAGAQRRASLRGAAAIERADVEDALRDAGGEEDLARAFVQPLSRPHERAGWGVRAVAFLVDGILLSFASWLVFGILSALLSPAMPGAVPPFLHDFDDSLRWDWDFDAWPTRGPWVVLILVSFALDLAYYTHFEGTMGQTPGKKVVGLRALKLDGRPLTHRDALLRNLTKITGLLVLLDSLFIFMKDEKLRGSDRVVETMVVRER